MYFRGVYLSFSKMLHYDIKDVFIIVQFQSAINYQTIPQLFFFQSRTFYINGA